MPGSIVDAPFQVTGSGPGISTVTTNTRVTGSLGPVMLATDVVSFAGGYVGTWIPTPSRVTINGQSIITQSSTGNATHPSSPPVPMLVSGGNPRLTGQ